MIRFHLSIAGFVLAVLTPRMLAQQPQAAPTFEVVSVKRNVSGDERTSSIVLPGGRYIATNVTLRTLMKTAHGVHDDQIVGGPDWIDIDRFDVVAKADTNATASEFVVRARLMLRPMLADRFKLVLRNDRREIPIYALMLARTDRRLGPQLRRSDDADCAGPPKVVQTAPGAPEENLPTPCGSSFFRPTHLGGRGAEFSAFFASLTRWTDRVVIDKTGLTGKFDWDLQWTTEPLTTTAAGQQGLSIFTALQEQLGLKLEAQRGIVDVLVVDRVERPQPD